MQINWERLPLAALLICVALVLADYVTETFGLSKAWSVPLSMLVVNKLWQLWDTYDFMNISIKRKDASPQTPAVGISNSNNRR